MLEMSRLKRIEPVNIQKVINDKIEERTAMAESLMQNREYTIDLMEYVVNHKL